MVRLEEPGIYLLANALTCDTLDNPAENQVVRVAVMKTCAWLGSLAASRLSSREIGLSRGTHWMNTL
jgi:hypothetical protein